MRKNVPSKYVFMLQCYFEEGCVHPVCKEGLLQNLAFLPLRVPDINLPFNGASCNKCGTQCNGHYMKYDEALTRLTELQEDILSTPTISCHTWNIQQVQINSPSHSFCWRLHKQHFCQKMRLLFGFNICNEKAENRHAGAQKPAIKRKEKKKFKTNPFLKKWCYYKRSSFHRG